MHSVNTQELDASFDEANAVPYSFSSGFVNLVSTISNTSRLQFLLAFNLINYGAMIGICSAHPTGRYNASFYVDSLFFQLSQFMFIPALIFHLIISL